MFRKYELVGMAAASFLLLVAVWLTQVERDFALFQAANESQVAAPGMVVVGDDNQAMADAVQGSINSDGTVRDLIVDDVEVGTGAEVTEGDTVTVHYVGTLPSGEEFDNSRKRGEPFTFTVGAGEVISGWEQGVTGMRVGGKRVLVIPPTLAYGNQGIGPIPGGATLVFAIEVLSVN